MKEFNLIFFILVTFNITVMIFFSCKSNHAFKKFSQLKILFKRFNEKNNTNVRACSIKPGRECMQIEM